MYFTLAALISLVFCSFIKGESGIDNSIRGPKGEIGNTGSPVGLSSCNSYVLDCNCGLQFINCKAYRIIWNAKM